MSGSINEGGGGFGHVASVFIFAFLSFGALSDLVDVESNADVTRVPESVSKGV